MKRRCCLAGAGGHEDDRHSAGPLAAAHQLGQLEAVHLGHLHVEKRKRDVVDEQELERLGPDRASDISSPRCRSAASARRFSSRSSTSRHLIRGNIAPSKSSGPPARLAGTQAPAGAAAISAKSSTRSTGRRSSAESIMSRGLRRLRLLHDRQPARIVHGREPLGAVLVRARQNDAEQTLAVDSAPPTRTARRSRAASDAPGRRPTAPVAVPRRPAGGSRAGAKYTVPGITGSLSSASRTGERALRARTRPPAGSAGPAADAARRTPRPRIRRAAPAAARTAPARRRPMRRSRPPRCRAVLVRRASSRRSRLW